MPDGGKAVVSVLIKGVQLKPLIALISSTVHDVNVQANLTHMPTILPE